MKKIFLAIVSVFILLVAGALIAPSFMDWNQYKAQVQEQIKTATGYDVAINGDLSVGLIPFPKAYVRDVIVKAVPGATAENLASVERVDLHLALLPLLSGKIAISQVSFVKPAIAIEMLAGGRQSWKTPEIEALMAPKADSAPGATSSSAKKADLDVSVQNFTVEDGSFSYTDKAAGTDLQVAGVNVSMNADSLSGPFKGQGSLSVNGQEIGFEAQTGRFGGGSDSVAVNASLDLKDALTAEYAGILGVGEKADLQGEATVKIPDLQKLAKAYGADLSGFKAASLELKGVLNANQESVSMKDMVLDMAGNRFEGELSGTLGGNVPEIKAALAAEKAVDLDKLFVLPTAGSGGGMMSSGSSESASGFLPGTIALPALSAAVSLRAPSVIYKGEEYRAVSLALATRGGAASLDMDVGTIPGQGSLVIEASLKQEEGKFPALALSVKGDSKNLPYTVEALDAGIDTASLESIKTAAIDLSATIYKDRIDFNNSSLELDGSPLAFSGSYALKGENSKPVLRLNAAAGTLDLNQFVAADNTAQATAPSENAAAPAQDFKKTLATLALPFDFDFDLSAESLTVQDYTMKGLVANGQWIKNNVTLEGFSVKDFAGAALQAKGKVENIQALNGVDLTVGAQANDVRAVAKVLKLDASSLPGNLGRTDVSAALKGSADNMNVLANIKALNGEVIVQGAVADPLGTMKADKLSLQVKHRSVNEAINIFSPGSGSYASLNGPLDVYTDVQIAGNTTSLNNIKARLAGASLQGQVSVNTGSSKPDINGSLTFDDLVIQSAKSAAAASSSGASGSSTSGGAPQWSREAIDTAWMQAVNFDLSLSGNSLKYEGWDLAKPAIKASLKDGMLRVDQLDAGMFQGQINMKASIHAGKGERQPLQVQADTKIRDVSLEPLVKAFVGVPLIKGAGQVSMDSVISASGVSPAALIYDLSGNGEITGKDIVLDGLDLTRFAKAMSDETKPGDTVLGLWKGSTKGGSTQFDTLDGNYTIQEGIINIAKLDLDGPKAAIGSTGKIDLPKWYIDTAHDITVKGEDIPPFTIKLSGSLSNPANTFGQGVLNDYLQRKLTRKLDSVIQDKLGDSKLGGALSNILGGGRAQQPVQQPQQQAPATATQTQSTANDNEPAAGDSWQQPADQQQPVQQQQQTAPQQQQPQEVKPEDAVKGLLKGLLQ
ncbi:MAG: AsmA family protein [Alphaproteobacteria bacterium]|nr:AsmA family protein [Alphaproteobacteria bacterium]MCD8570807.1 AsmA family protein [Alphaproteobacteria bacterium]